MIPLRVKAPEVTRDALSKEGVIFMVKRDNYALEQPTQGRSQESYKENHYYVYGTAVPLPEDHPDSQGDIEQTALPAEAPKPEKQEKKSKRKLSDTQIRQNRRRARSIGLGYSIYIFSVSVIFVMACVFFLQLHANNISSSHNVTRLRGQLSEMTEQNNAAHQSILNSINMEEVRSRAVYDLGLIQLSHAYVIEYTNPNSRYVRMHNEIPSTGVLAQTASFLD